jgi:glycosyltransferase involved in cell wall biosynthesis
MSKLKVSIVTPSYNHGKYIEETIKSVMNQDYPNIEHIIVDGGSTDETLNILKKYPHLKWISEPDEGQSDAVNKGFKMATGDIIGWLNSDDTYVPNIIGRVVKEFEKDDELDMLYGGRNDIDENGKVICTYYAPQFDLKKLIISCNCYISQPSTFYRRRIFDKIGYLDKKLHYSMDHDYFIRIGMKGKIKKINMVISNFRKHRATKTFKYNIMAKKESYELGKKYGYGRNIFLHLNYIKYRLIYLYPPLTEILRKTWIFVHKNFKIKPTDH